MFSKAFFWKKLIVPVVTCFLLIGGTSDKVEARGGGHHGGHHGHHGGHHGHHGGHHGHHGGHHGNHGHHGHHRGWNHGGWGGYGGYGWGGPVYEGGYYPSTYTDYPYGGSTTIYTNPNGSSATPYPILIEQPVNNTTTPANSNPYYNPQGTSPQNSQSQGSGSVMYHGK